MCLLNTNYDGVYQQIKNMENYFLDCDSLDSAVYFYGVYQYLKDLYYWATLKNPCDKKNKYINFFLSKRLDSLYKKNINHFINQQRSHYAYVNSIFFEFSEIVDEVINSYEYNTLTEMPIISEDEGYYILCSFFDECCPRMRDLFESFLEQRKIYSFPSVDLYSSSDGCTVYNPIENNCSLFLQSDLKSLRLLSTIVHEMSHVEDILSYSSQNSPVNTRIYQMCSPFSEVSAFYYQFQFYDYLFKNNVYKDAVLSELACSLEDVSMTMNDLLLFSMMPSKKLKKYNTLVSKREVLRAAVKNTGKDCQFQFDDSKISDVEISLVDSVLYCYGPLLSFAMLDDSNLYKSFSAIRDSEFDISKLYSMGFSQYEICQKVMKKCQDFFSHR